MTCLFSSLSQETFQLQQCRTQLAHGTRLGIEMQGTGIPRCGLQSRRTALALPILAALSEAVSGAVEPAQRAMKRTYSSMWTGEDLGEDYGSNTQGPPKDRRAGMHVTA